MTHKGMVNARPLKKPKLGQHFLTDASAAGRIVDALGDIGSGLVIEIGPGRGALTGLLAKRAGKLITVEFDRLLATQMRVHFARQPNVEVIEGDVLSLDFHTLVQGPRQGVKDRQPGAGEKAKVVGNLPYYITSDILLKLFESHLEFVNIVIMVQREVAERIAAQPGTRDYGLLTVTAQLYADIENLFTLPPQAFAPPPKVHSSVLRLTLAPKYGHLGVAPEEFMAFAKTAFAQKRKTLANNLRAGFADARIAAAIKQAGLRSDVRAEAASLDQLAQIFRALAATS